LAKLIKKINPEISKLDFVREEGFSLKSLGLLIFLLGLPDESVFSLEDLAEHFSDGISSIRNAVSLLETLGYFTRHKIRVKGKINYNYIVSNYIQIKKNKSTDEIFKNNYNEDLIDKPLIDKIEKLQKNNDLNDLFSVIEKPEVENENIFNEIFEYYTSNVKLGSRAISIRYIKELMDLGYSKNDFRSIINDYKKSEKKFLYKNADVFFQEVALKSLKNINNVNNEVSTKKILFNKFFNFNNGGNK